MKCQRSEKANNQGRIYKMKREKLIIWKENVLVVSTDFDQDN